MRPTPLRHKRGRIRQFFWRRILALFLAFTLTAPSSALALRQPQATETGRPDRRDVLNQLGQELLQVAQQMGVPVQPAAPAAGLEEYFVSQDEQQSAKLRQALWNRPEAAEEQEAFVSAVLRPFEKSPTPAEGLLQLGAGYKTSTISVDESKVKVLRSMAEDLIRRSINDSQIQTAAIDVVEFFLSRLDQPVVSDRPLRGMWDNEAVEMMLELIRVATGVDHPYKTFNQQVNEQALSWLQVMDQVVRGSEDPLGTAISLGIIGNALDFADQAQRQRLAESGFDDVRDEIRRAPTLAYGVDQRADLIQALQSKKSGHLLFLTDNAGEIVFDLPLLKLFLEQGWQITIAGKRLPHVNDMTVGELRELFRDARVLGYLGAEQVSNSIRIISSGTAMTGFDMRRASPEMVEQWLKADIVYTKGQGMIETLRYAAHTRVIFQAVLVKQPAYFKERDANGRPLTLKRAEPLFLKTEPAAGLEQDGIEVIDPEDGKRLLIPYGGRTIGLDDWESVPAQLSDLIGLQARRFIPTSDIVSGTTLFIQRGLLSSRMIESLKGVELAGEDIEIQEFNLEDIPPAAPGRKNVYLATFQHGTELEARIHRRGILINLYGSKLGERPETPEALGGLIEMARRFGGLLRVEAVYSSQLQNDVIALDLSA